MTPGIDDITYYTMVARPYKYWLLGKQRKEPTWRIHGLTYEDLLFQYYDYKEGLKDARAQADRWRHQ